MSFRTFPSDKAESFLMSPCERHIKPLNANCTLTEALLCHVKTELALVCTDPRILLKYRCPIPFSSARKNQMLRGRQGLPTVPEKVNRCYNIRIHSPPGLWSRPQVNAHSDLHPIPRNSKRLFPKRTRWHGTDSSRRDL